MIRVDEATHPPPCMKNKTGILAFGSIDPETKTLAIASEVISMHEESSIDSLQE